VSGYPSRCVRYSMRPGSLGGDAGSVAVAAAKVIASAEGKGPVATSADAAPCFAKTRSPEVRALAPRARQAISRVWTPDLPNSLNYGQQANQTDGLMESASLRRVSSGDSSIRPIAAPHHRRPIYLGKVLSQSRRMRIVRFHLG
jgi:hypothetical protein